MDRSWIIVGSIVASIVASIVVTTACGGEHRAPATVAASTAPAASTSAAPSGPFVARDLDGPFASLADYCAKMARKEEWSADRRCRLDETPIASAPSSDAAARVLRIDDVVAGGVSQLACRLVIVTPAGTFVDDADVADPCEGMTGPTSHVHTTFDELAWSKGVLRARTREVRAEGEWKENAGAPKDLVYAGATTDRLVLCSLAATAVPRCTPPIVVGCSDSQSPTHAHAIAWSVEGATLHLRSNEASSDLACDSGAELVVGDSVLW